MARPDFSICRKIPKNSTISPNPQSYAAEYRHLDAALWREIMRSVQSSHNYNVVYSSESVSLWADKVFGAAGWERVYPHSLSVRVLVLEKAESRFSLHYI